MAQLVWMLILGALLAAGTGWLVPPALDRRLAALLVGLALLPLAPALRSGAVYGPLDTNVPNLPWATAADKGYVSKGGALNDVTLQFVPWQAEARRQLLAGRVPLLNPFSGSGEPLLGNGQAAPFSLVSLLSLPLEPVHAQGLRAFLKLLLALLGTFLVARQLGCHPAFSLVAAVAYAYGGALAVWRLFPHAEVMALFPFAFLGVERLLANPNARRSRLLLFSAAAGMILAGHPETAVLGGLALGCRALAALRSKRAGALVVLAVLCLAAGATAFFSFPVAGSVLASEKLAREGGGRDPGLGTGGPWWGGLANMAAPGIFGTPQRSAEHGPAPLHWLAEGSIGLLCLAFALGGIAAFRSRSPTERFLTVLAVVAFSLYLNAFGLAGRLFSLPLLSAVAVRYLAYLGSFAVAVLAARALTLWSQEESPAARAKAGLFAAAAAGVILAVASRFIVLHFWRESGALAALGSAVTGEADRHWHVALIAAAGLLACLLLRRHPILAGSLAAGLTALQLLGGLGGYVPAVSTAQAYPPLPLVDRLRQDPRLFRVAGTRGVFFPNSSTYYRIADVRTHDPTEPARYVDWLADLLSLDRSTYKKQYRRPTPAHEPFLRLLGVRYLLSGPDLELPKPWIDRGLFRQTRLWELGGDTRWAFFPTAVAAASSPQAARDLIRGGKDPYALAGLEIPGPATAQANGDATVAGVGARGGRLLIDVEVKETSWLVVSQSALRGWRASNEHGSLETAVADGALLAVRVPAGTRRVALRYLPAPFVAGLLLAVASCVAFAAVGLRSRRLPHPS